MTDSAGNVTHPFVMPTAPAVPTVHPSAVFSWAIEAIFGTIVWVTGQQTGSLSCTGLGYWVVFDSFGVALSRIIPGYLVRIRCNPGAAVLWVFLFLSSADRVRRVKPKGWPTAELCSVRLPDICVGCKGTVEQLLLSANDDQQHHSDGYVVYSAKAYFVT